MEQSDGRWEDRRRQSGDRTASLALAVGSILALALMAHHPRMAAGGLEDALERLRGTAHLSALVHGGLIADLGLLLFGFLGLCDTLGRRHAGARLAAQAYTLGAVALMGAGLVSGFVTPRLGSHFVGGAAAEVAAVAPALRLCWEANQALSQAGTCALSIALLAASLVLLRRGRAGRWLAAAGLAVGVLPLAGLLLGRLELHLAGMGAVLLAQGLWNLGAAAWLWTRPVAPADAVGPAAGT